MSYWQFFLSSENNYVIHRDSRKSRIKFTLKCYIIIGVFLKSDYKIQKQVRIIFLQKET